MDHRYTNWVVVGAGQMGQGIAQVALAAGCRVSLVDPSAEARQKAEHGISKGIKRWGEKCIVSDVPATLAELTTFDGLDTAPPASVYVEAATENLELKKKIFCQIDDLAPTDALLASNTSSISITELAATTTRPDAVIGLHFFNPVPLMKLVEIIRGERTSDESVEAAVHIAKELGKTPVLASDLPGFVSNRILMPMINEAICALGDGVSSVEGIDEVMKLGMAHPMGPLELADLIGLDTCLNIMNVLHEGFADSKYRPHPLLRRKVAAGLLGRKSGQGFYNYNNEEKLP